MARSDIGNSILSSAQQTLSSIMRSRSPQEAKALKGSLIMLAGKANSEDMSTQLTVYAYVDAADGYITELEREEYAEIARGIAAERFILDQATRDIYSDLQNNKLLSQDEINYINSIDEKAVYILPEFDENGNVIKGGKNIVTGAELKESAILLEAYKNKDKLSLEAQKKLNYKLHGHTGEATSAADIKKDMDALGKAARDVHGHAYSMASTPEEKEKVVGTLKGLLQTTTMIAGQSFKKEQLPADSPMLAPAEAVLKNEQATIKEKIKATMADTSALFIKNKTDATALVAEKPAEKPLPTISLNQVTTALLPETAKSLEMPEKKVAAVITNAVTTTPVLVTAAPASVLTPSMPAANTADLVKKTMDDMIMEDSDAILALDQGMTTATVSPAITSANKLLPGMSQPPSIITTQVASSDKPAPQSAPTTYSSMSVSLTNPVSPGNPFQAPKANTVNLRS